MIRVQIEITDRLLDPIMYFYFKGKFMTAVLRLIVIVLLPMPCLLAQIPSYVPTNGLIGWWPFNGNANDESGNGNIGTVTRATLTDDRSGNKNSAYRFDYEGQTFGNQNKEIYIPYNPTFSSAKITVSIWLKPRQYFWSGNNGDPNSVIVRRFEEGYSNPNGQTWGLQYNENNYSAFVSAPSTSNSQTGDVVVHNQPLKLDEWVHIAMTFDGQVLRLFRNGVTVDSITSKLGYMNTLGTSGISIGVSRQANGFWNEADADIDDLGFWNRALSQSEIKSLFTSTISNLEESVVPHISISPNPPGESDNILVRFSEIPNQDISIELLDILGSVYYSNKIQSGSESCTIPVQGLTSGMYILRVRKNNDLFIEKVIVN